MFEVMEKFMLMAALVKMVLTMQNTLNGKMETHLQKIDEVIQ